MSTRQEEMPPELRSPHDHRLEATQKIVGEVFETLRSLEDSDFADPDAGRRKAIYWTRNALDRLENAMLGIPGVRASRAEIAKGLGMSDDRGILDANAVQISPDENAEAARRELAQRQYAIASKFPDEYTVLRGTLLVFHSKNRAEALEHYDASHSEASGESPVFIAPNKREERTPNVLRGRTISRI